MVKVVCTVLSGGKGGDYFKTLPIAMLSQASAFAPWGNIAWLHPEDTIKQRERLKAERIADREQRIELMRAIQQQSDNVSDEVIELTESEHEPIFEDEDLEQEESFEMSM